MAGQVERAVMRPVEHEHGCATHYHARATCDCAPRTVAALYVEPKGCYVGVPGVLESADATQNTGSKKSLPRCLPSRAARESQADNGRLEGKQSRARRSKQQSVERKERGQIARVQGAIQGEEQRGYTQGAICLAGKSWVQRSAKGSRRERQTTTSALWPHVRNLLSDFGSAGWRVRNLPNDKSRHEECLKAVRGPLPQDKPSARPALSGMQHDAWCCLGFAGNTQARGGVS